MTTETLKHERGDKAVPRAENGSAASNADNQSVIAEAIAKLDNGQQPGASGRLDAGVTSDL